MKMMKLSSVPTVCLEVSSELGQRVPWLTELKVHTGQDDIARATRTENSWWSFSSFAHDFMRIQSVGAESDPEFSGWLAWRCLAWISLYAMQS